MLLTKPFDYIIIGGGIAGLLTAYEFREFNTLLIDRDGILKSGASAAAGAFLFIKVGYNTAYTKFINRSILEALSFYESLGIETHKKGVLILPRDKRDYEKFKKYEKEITIPFKKIDGGFYFKDSGVVDPQEVREKIKVDFLQKKVKSIYKDGEYWIVEGLKTKNVILASGHETLVDCDYINIRPVWGERIEGISDLEELEYHYHKNCSLAIIDGVTKIGATHKRNCQHCEVNMQEAEELLQKANEIKPIHSFIFTKTVGGFRAASSDYFPIVGNIIDVKKTLQLQPKIIKGEIPKKVEYIDGLYIINGMGGRGFSNAVSCAKRLKSYIINKKPLGKLDTIRLFIKWARKLQRIDNVKG